MVRIHCAPAWFCTQRILPPAPAAFGGFSAMPRFLVFAAGFSAVLRSIPAAGSDGTAHLNACLRAAANAYILSSSVHGSATNTCHGSAPACLSTATTCTAVLFFLRFHLLCVPFLVLVCVLVGLSCFFFLLPLLHTTTWFPTHITTYHPHNSAGFSTHLLYITTIPPPRRRFPLPLHHISSLHSILPFCHHFCFWFSYILILLF